MRPVSVILRPVIACALSAAAAVASVARGQAAPVAREAVGVPGEPLLIEVRVAATAGATVELIDPADPRPKPLDARILWPILPAPAGDSLLRWSAAANPMRFVESRPRGPDGVPQSSAFLAVTLPLDLGVRTEPEPRGSSLRRAEPRPLQLRVDGATVGLRLQPPSPPDLPARLAARASMLVPQGERTDLLSLPDPAAPFERFRTTLGVAMRGWSEPEPFAEGSADALAARAHTALWMAALGRAMEAGPGPTVELAELLVATCSDDTAPAPIAAWIAGAEELRTALRLLLEPEFRGERLAASINEFVRVRQPVLWWIEDSDERSVAFAFANPTTRPQLVRFHWVIGSEEDMLPLALEVPATEVRRTRVKRPTLERRWFMSGEPEAIERLRIACGSMDRSVLVPPARVPVGAAGVSISDFFAPLSLPTVSPGARTTPAIATSTTVSLRERLPGWELFIETRQLADEPSRGSDPREAPHSVHACGRAGSVRIDANGAATVEGCDLPPEALAFAAYPDRTRAAFPLPPEWIVRDDAAVVVEAGFRRTLPGGFVDAPFPCVPWRTRPRTAAFDLTPRQ
jgi:hypothetical protein